MIALTPNQKASHNWAVYMYGFHIQATHTADMRKHKKETDMARAVNRLRESCGLAPLPLPPPPQMITGPDYV